MITDTSVRVRWQPTKTHLTALPLASRFQPSMTAAHAASTPVPAFGSDARASGVVVGLVVGLELISSCAVAG